MLENEIKKLTEATLANTEATLINNKLLTDHIKIREACSKNSTAEVPESCSKKTEKAEPEEEDEVDETKKLIDEANAREEKKRKAAAAKKAKAEKAAAAEEAEEEAEEEETSNDGDTAATHDDLRTYVQTIRKQLKKDDGPEAVSKHRKDFRELLKDASYNSISDIPEDEIADFLEDTKALVE
jgi:hypothetical protein